MQKDIAMKFIHLIISVSFGLVLLGCTSTSKTPPSPKTQSPAINPISVTLYTNKQKPEKPFIVLGHESVSKYNKVGIKRQEANLKDSIRQLAATKGGNAVIDITHHPDSISYTVINTDKA